MMQWPKQSQCIPFYGNPALADFQRKNLVAIRTPWQSFYGASPVVSMMVNKKCADAFQDWFQTVWKNAGQKQYVISAWGMSNYGGAFVNRLKRSGNGYSMHAFGCAIDFDPARNAYKDTTPHFAEPTVHDAVVAPFKALGGVWGGDWKSPVDGMHFQFAVVG